MWESIETEIIQKNLTYQIDLAKGGDYGIDETLHRFGLPFFIEIIVGLIILIRSALKWMIISGASRSLQSRYLWFAIYVTIYLLFTEIHYTV